MKGIDTVLLSPCSPDGEYIALSLPSDIDLDRIRGLLGKVNDQVFYGCRPRTVLFSRFSAARTISGGWELLYGFTLCRAGFAVTVCGLGSDKDQVVHMRYAGNFSELAVSHPVLAGPEMEDPE